MGPGIVGRVLVFVSKSIRRLLSVLVGKGRYFVIRIIS